MSSYTLESPNQCTVLHLDLVDGWPGYTVEYEGETIVDRSSLGLVFRDASFDGPFAVVETTREHRDETWQPIWGTQAEIRDHHEELRIELAETDDPGRRLEIVFRAFDDGVAFRYRLPDQPGIDAFAITNEHTEFRFADDFEAWWIPNDDDSYEFLYEQTPLSEIDGAHTPLTMRTDEGHYVSLHEARLLDYAAMSAVSDGNDSTHFECDLEPLPDGTKVEGSTPHVSPWRTLTLGDDPGALIESNLIVNLNDPPAFDADWVEPMNYVGIWWGMHLDEFTWAAGENHGATTGRTKQYVDFAAEHDIGGVLTEGWNVGWDGEDWGDQDYTTPAEDFDPEAVVEYASDRGVDWIAHAETGATVENFEAQLADALAYYDDVGAAGLKTGYVGDIDDHTHHNQRMVDHHREVLERAAEHELMIDAHEPVKPTGLRRTYPNAMTWEGVRGMEFNAWESGNPPAHTVTLPFTRMLAGPLDYTPGIFDIAFDRPAEGPSGQDSYRVYTTRAHQLALYPILFSGLQMIADRPEHYYDDLDAFAFLEDVPTIWDDTRVLEGSIGEFVAIARRNGVEWFLGVATDDNPRGLDLSLSFLDDDRTYVAEIYADGPDAHWEDNPTPVARQTVQVDSADSFHAALAAGGGQAVRFVPLDAADEVTDGAVCYEPPTLAYEQLLVNYTASPDTPTQVTAAVHNEGTVVGHEEVSLFVDGEAIASTTIRVGPGETASVAFDVEFGEAGAHDVTIGSSLDGAPDAKSVVVEPTQDVQTVRARPCEP